MKSRKHPPLTPLQERIIEMNARAVEHAPVVERFYLCGTDGVRAEWRKPCPITGADGCQCARCRKLARKREQNARARAKAKAAGGCSRPQEDN